MLDRQVVWKDLCMQDCWTRIFGICSQPTSSDVRGRRIVFNASEIFASPTVVSSGTLPFLECSLRGSKCLGRLPDGSLAWAGSWHLNKSVSRFSSTQSKEIGLARWERKIMAPLNLAELFFHRRQNRPRISRACRTCGFPHWVLPIRHVWEPRRNSGQCLLLSLQDRTDRGRRNVIKYFAGLSAPVWCSG